MIPSYAYICIFIYIHRFAFALVCVCVYHPWLSFFPTLSLKHFVCLIFCFPTFKGHMDFDRIPQTLARSTVATRQLDLPKDAWLRSGSSGQLFSSQVPQVPKEPGILGICEYPGVYGDFHFCSWDRVSTWSVNSWGTNCLTFFSGLNRMNRVRNWQLV